MNTSAGVSAFVTSWRLLRSPAVIAAIRNEHPFSGDVCDNSPFSAVLQMTSALLGDLPSVPEEHLPLRNTTSVLNVLLLPVLVFTVHVEPFRAPILQASGSLCSCTHFDCYSQFLPHRIRSDFCDGVSTRQD